jgi:hypothetical protein
MFESLAQIAENTMKTADATEDTAVATERSSLPGLLPPKAANDFIIPSQGAPIIPDSADTIMGFKPGGPLAGMMGGGGGGNIEINIWGGDQSQVYNTIMEVLNRSDNS